jgi:Leucine-rich repeat (LRR) protein
MVLPLYKLTDTVLLNAITFFFFNIYLPKKKGVFCNVLFSLFRKLDYNNITNVTKGWLYGLSSLKELNLSYNQVKNIDHSGWEFCPDLIEL